MTNKKGELLQNIHHIAKVLAINLSFAAMLMFKSILKTLSFFLLLEKLVKISSLCFLLPSPPLCPFRICPSPRSLPNAQLPLLQPLWLHTHKYNLMSSVQCCLHVHISRADHLELDTNQGPQPWALVLRSWLVLADRLLGFHRYSFLADHTFFFL